MKSKFLNWKYFLILLSVLYYPYLNVISWGGDYAHYILQGKNINNLNYFIENQQYLNSITENNRFGIYTSFGFPLLLYFSSFLHSWNIYIIKLITPICLGIISYLFIKNLKNKDLKLIYLIFLLNPNLNDSFKDIFTEIPAIMFFLLALNFRNKPIIKNTLLLICCLIRPTFLIFIMIDLIFESYKKKTYKNIINFLIIFISSNLLFRYFADYNLLGNYSTSYSSTSVSSSLISFDIFGLFNSLVPVFFERLFFLISEIGRLFSGFSNPVNIIFGFFILLLLVLKRNKYSYMFISFSFFHLLIGTPYYVRYFLPLIFIFILYLNELNFKFSLGRINKIFLLSVFLVFSFLSLNNFLNLDKQRGPHQISSKEAIEFVNVYLPDELIAFHSPRVLRVLTQNDAYRYDKNYIQNSIWVCEKSKETCSFNREFEVLFENDLYIILK